MPSDEKAQPLSAEERILDAFAVCLEENLEDWQSASWKAVSDWLAAHGYQGERPVDAILDVMGSMVDALRARDELIELLRDTLRRIPSLTCPCCGCEGAWPTLFEDGGPTDCGCGGFVSVDVEDGAVISVLECSNPECDHVE